MDSKQTQKATTLDPARAALRKQMVKMGASFLLRDDNAAHIVTKAKATKDPAHTVAEALTPLMTNLWRMAAVSGQKVDMVTLLSAAIELIALMGKMLEQAGVLTEQQIPDFCTQVAKLCVNQHNTQLVQRAGGGQDQMAAPAARAATAGGMMGMAGMAGAAPQGA